MRYRFGFRPCDMGCEDILGLLGSLKFQGHICRGVDLLFGVSGCGLEDFRGEFRIGRGNNPFGIRLWCDKVWYLFGHIWRGRELNWYGCILGLGSLSIRIRD